MILLAVRWTARVFGPKPGLYGLSMGAAIEDYSETGQAAAGEAWLKGSEWTVGTGEARQDRAALEAQVRGADGFVHVQDLMESDLLLASDYAAHEGGFAAAVARLGGAEKALYHLDATQPDRLRARTLPEEIARVVRTRAANPAWADGMVAHGFRGAAEIAATLDHLAAFAHLAISFPEERGAFPHFRAFKPALRIGVQLLERVELRPVVEIIHLGIHGFGRCGHIR